MVLGCKGLRCCLMNNQYGQLQLQHRTIDLFHEIDLTENLLPFQ